MVYCFYCHQGLSCCICRKVEDFFKKAYSIKDPSVQAIIDYVNKEGKDCKGDKGA